MDSGSECRKPVSGLTKVWEEPASDILPGMTAFERPGTRRISGFDDFLSKPFRESDLFGRIRTHLGVRYVCDDPRESEEEGKAELRPESLAALPSELLTKLEKSLVLADVGGISEVIRDIRGYDAELARGLERQIDDFDYDSILDEIQKLGTGKYDEL